MPEPEALYRVVCCGVVLYHGSDEEQAVHFFEHMDQKDGHVAEFLRAELLWEPVPA